MEEEWAGTSVLVHGGDDIDAHVRADVNGVPLHWIPYEKEDNDDDDHDDVHNHDNVHDDVCDDGYDDDDDVPPYAINGVF